MEEEFDKIFADIKLNFEKKEDVNDKKLDILAEQLSLNEYISNNDEINASELYEKIVDKYNSINKDNNV